VTTPVPRSHPDESTTGKHLPALDGIRGLAILSVLYCHLFWSNPDPAGSPLLRFFAQLRAAGWIGVDLFFVLSGFLITGILYDTLPARRFFRNFYARRVLRIFPLYYGFFLLLLVITSIRGEHWSAITLLQYLTYVANLPLSNQPPLTNGYWINVNHFWSLAVEEQFYLVWPLLVFLLRTRRRIAMAAVIGAGASLAVRLALVLSGATALHPYLVYSWTPARLDGLFLGGLLAIAVRSRFRQRVLAAAVPVLLSCCAVLVVVWFFDPAFEILGQPAFSTWGLTLLAFTFTSLIAACLRHDGWLQRFASARFLRFFGRYSYGLYIYHYTVGGLIISRLRPELLARFGSKALSVVVPGLIAAAASVAVSWCSFNFFESRFLLLKRKFHDSSPRPKLHEVAEV
jgi:peptidoglycan/LPS O-acetylase OafA/YrhL